MEQFSRISFYEQTLPRYILLLTHLRLFDKVSLASYQLNHTRHLVSISFE